MPLKRENDRPLWPPQDGCIPENRAPLERPGDIPDALAQMSGQLRTLDTRVRALDNWVSTLTKLLLLLAVIVAATLAIALLR
jgi:hypothetical protein